MSLIERLRNLQEQRREYGHGLNFAVEGDDVDVALTEARAELEANAAEIERLRGALEGARKFIVTEIVPYVAADRHRKQREVLDKIDAALNKQESGKCLTV